MKRRHSCYSGSFLFLLEVTMQGHAVTCFSVARRGVTRWVGQQQGQHVFKKSKESLLLTPTRRRLSTSISSTTTSVDTRHFENNSTNEVLSAAPTISTSSTVVKDESNENDSHQYSNRTFVEDSTASDSGSIDWRVDPSINPVIAFPTWIVPSKHCQAVLSGAEFQQELASSYADMQHVHPRIKLVQSCDSDKDSVLILRNPSTQQPSEELQERLEECGIKDGPPFEIQIPYTRWTWQYVLSKLLPPDVQPPPNSYEQVGHLIHLNLKPHHIPFQHLIGDVLLQVLKPQGIQTVVNKVGEVSGPHRTFDMEVLAGDPETRVSLTEHGLKIDLDISKVYWNSRLSGERLYLIEHEFQPNQIVADVFCGVGALCCLAAKRVRNCKIWANDWNPDAIEFFKMNLEQNNLFKGKSNHCQVSCTDAYDYLTDIGLLQQQLPHHVIMNYPLEAPKFLTALRWWPSSKHNSKKSVVPRFHVYTFVRVKPHENAASVAIDLVAHYLLPQARDPTPDRQQDLNQLGCDISARQVRDVAPGKLVLCVSFSATHKLIRHMQGDYV